MKNNRQEEAKLFFEALDNHDDFLVVTHINPDGDTVGSALAVANYLRQRAKKFTLINEKSLTANYFALPLAGEFKTADEVNRKFDTIITLDCADIYRIGDRVRALFVDQPAVFINVDHHRTNDGFAILNIIDDQAASTTLVLYNLFKDADIVLNHDIAMCLYTGLVTDTGSFRNSNTDSQTHLMAADLLSYGVKANEVIDKIVEANSYTQLKVISDSLSTLTIEADGRVATIDVVIAPEFSTSEESHDSLVNYPKSVEGVEVAIAYKPIEDNKVKLSFRAKNYVDVSTIAASFGGGGHIRAAGCTFSLDDYSLEEVKKMVLAKVIEAL